MHLIPDILTLSLAGTSFVSFFSALNSVFDLSPTSSNPSSTVPSVQGKMEWGVNYG
jgi:hypothetical protein